MKPANGVVAATSILENRPSPEKRMQIGKITRGIVEAPDRVLLAGTEGIGKSTWAAAAPSPVFVPAEDGTGQLDVARFPAPRTWSDVLESIDVMRTDAHDFKTIVFDTVDAMEPLLWKHICERDKQSSIEAYGYGKGYVAALDEWRIFLAALERLRRDRDVAVILIAHTAIRTFKNPTGEDYDRYELKLNAKAAGLLREWCDSMLFAHYETFTNKEGSKAKGISTGARVVSTQRTAGWEAKNRYCLPEFLPLNYDDYASAVKARQPRSSVDLRVSIAGKLKQLKDETKRTQAEAFVKSIGDNAALLAQADNRLTALLSAEGA